MAISVPAVKKRAEGGGRRPEATRKFIARPSASVCNILPPSAPGEMTEGLCSALQDGRTSMIHFLPAVCTCVVCSGGKTIDPPPQTYLGMARRRVIWKGTRDEMRLTNKV